MADYGFKVSQAGYDVKTATDLQLVYASKFWSLAAVTHATGTIGGGGTGIAHSLGYTPAFLLFVSDTDGQGESGYMLANNVGIQGVDNVVAYADNSEIRIDGGGGNNYSLFIFNNKVN